MENKLRETARTFLERPDGDYFIGYEESSSGLMIPLFLKDPRQVDRLVWNDKCFPNLTTYLPRFRKSTKVVAIVVKGCDARALRELIRANQIDRSQLFVVGLPCEGLEGPGGSGIAARCYGCLYPRDFFYDAVLGEMKTPDLPLLPEDKRLESLSNEKRKDFWQMELEKCIRCNACQKICYGCFCPECIFESLQPKWLPGNLSISEKYMFHAIRLLHLAGRCIQCGECERVCPAGIPLMRLNRQIQDDCHDLFAFDGIGVNEELPPLLSFSKDDPDPFKGDLF